MFASAPAILHVDMDAFFASVEQARRPELRGLPVVVGGERERRGVVATASYEARACGVRTAMPLTQAERLCPKAVFLPVDMAAYVGVHRALLELFWQFTDRVEAVSIDEAFLDVAGSRRLFGPPLVIARRLQEQVYREQHLTCSLGVGPNKLLAKLAANLHKPAGIGALCDDDVYGRLRELPVRELVGVGPVTEQRLQALGLTTVGMLQDMPLHLLTAAFGAEARVLKQLAFGRSFSPVRGAPVTPKSVGRETTFGEDTDDPAMLRATLLRLADEVAWRLRRKGLAARSVTLKVRLHTFHTTSRRYTLPGATAGTRQLYEAACGLLAQLDLRGRWVRLLGLTASSLQTRACQLTLDDQWKEIALSDAVDRVRAKHGSCSIGFAGYAGTAAMC